jgi:DNA-binding MarR family transcriptional regulator
MDKDFFKEIKYFALTARLKRISDDLLYSAKDLYKTLDLEIAPNWHLVFLLFQKQDTLTMTEIAEAFQLSQTAVIKIINKMKSKGYLESTKDAKDSRRQLLQLSQKAKEELPKLKVVWEAGRKSIADILEGEEEIFKQLSAIEKAIKKQTYKERSMEYLKNNN